MRSLSLFTWRNLTAHLLRSVLTALAITLGVGMVLAAAIVGQAASQSAAELSDEGPQIDLQVFARDGTSFDETVLDTLRASPDVELVSPSLRVEGEGVRPAISRLTLLGVDPEAYHTLHGPELAGGTFLDEPDAIVLPMMVAIEHGLHIGDEVTLRVPGTVEGDVGDRFVTLTVVGRLKMKADSVPVGQSPTALVPLRVAGDSGQIDQVEVALRLGTDIDQAKADLAQRIGTDLAVVRAEVAAGGVAFNTLVIQSGLAMVGLIILFAAGFVILNAFAMTVTGRTREIGALRALGMTRRQVTQAVLAEASLLGLLGAGVGVLLGLGLGWGVMRAMGLLDDVPFVVPWWGVAFSPLMGLGVTLVGALQPAWRASRVSPIVAVRPETTVASGWYVRSGGRVGLVLLLFLLPALAAYGLIGRPDIWTAMVVTGMGIVSLLVVMVLLLPALVALVAALCRPVLVHWLGTAGRLAADNLGRNRRRSALTAGALVAGLTMIMTTSGLLTLFMEGSIGTISSAMHEDIVVIPNLVEMMTLGEITLENIYQDMADLTMEPAVAHAFAPLVEAGTIELQRVGIAPVPPDLVTVPTGRLTAGMFVDLDVFIRIGNFDFYQGDPETALDWMQRDRVVLLQPLAAERLGVGVGDSIPIETSHGEIEFTVAGVGGSGLFSPIFAYADGEAYFDLAGLFQLGIVVADGQDVDAVLAQVQEIVQPFPGVVVMKDVNSVIDEASKMFGQFQALLSALLMLAVVVAGLGVVNTMVINVTERGREIGLLRAVGATQRQVRQAVVAEAATLGLMAALTAAALGLLMMLVYVLIVTPNGWGALGVRSDWEMVWSNLLSALRNMGIAVAVSFIFGPLVAGLAAHYPARQAAATDVIEATRSEQVTLKRTRPPRRESRRRVTRSLTWTMAWRNLDQGRTRTILSALAVALGTATIVAADVTGEAIRNAGQAIEGSQGTVTFVGDFLNSGLSIMGLVILVAAGFLIFNAFGMAVTQRQRQIGALRSLGMTRRQVMRLVLVEALIIGGAGTLLGLTMGPLLGRGLIVLLAELAGVAHGQGSMAVGGLLRAVASGLAITLLATLLPAWRATRIAPLVALRVQEAAGMEDNQKGRAALGLFLITVLTVYLLVNPPAAAIPPPPWDIVLTGLFAMGWLVSLALMLPFLVSGASSAGRWISGRWIGGRLGAIGRLMADNLGRARLRVMLTIVTLAIGLMMIVSVTGITGFSFEVVIAQVLSQYNLEWIIGPLSPSSDGSLVNWEAVSRWDLDTMRLTPEFLADLERLAAGRANLVHIPYVDVPELAIISGLPSLVVDPSELRQAGLFTFTEGDWETAQPIMESGCGLLLMPRMARKHNVWLYDTFTLSGVKGPVTCTVAGLGTSSFMGSSIISAAAGDDLGLDPNRVFFTIVQPLPGVDKEALRADLDALLAEYPANSLIEVDAYFKDVSEMIDSLQVMLNGMLLLAILAAALGVVNTTVMSVAERRRELGLLRAVGAMRRQVTAVVAGEAALMGLIGGGLGLVAGLGLVLIFVAVNGGNMWGLSDLPLWSSAWTSIRPAILNGLIGLVAAPLICAGAAWLPARAILRGSAIETLQVERQQPISPRRVAAGLLRWGSIRTRFVVSTAILMAIVLAGLTAVVTTHARTRTERQAHDALRTLVTWNAGLIELSLPDDAETLDFDVLQSGQTFDLDADVLLRFESLVDDMTANGLDSFIIADRDNVVLVSLDRREIGTLAPELESVGEVDVHSVRQAGEWRMHACAPVRNEEGRVIGSVRLAVDASQIKDFVVRLRNALWAAGGAIILAGLAISWWLSAPLVRAERTGCQEYALAERSRQRGVGDKLSLRARLTIVLALTAALMAAVLQVVAIPIERRHVRDTLKDSLVAGAEWMGQVVSDSFDDGLTKGLSLDQLFSLDKAFSSLETLDLGRLQTLIEQAQSDDVAYTALVGEDGTILVSDQLALIGEQVPLPGDTHLEETTWRDEGVWVVSTPLRRGRGGEQVGALRLGVRRVRVEAFLDESRNLFRLTGLIAVLAGVLLAQAIGGAVTAPVRQLAADARRVGQRGLDVQFEVDTHDELALLVTAFNHMVTKLREREWLHDMFGRFVSHEVAEAIRTGQVKLEGENRVVSVLFCDIQDFGVRSERSTPEEMVALLNEYLAVVVGAAQRHGGTVNKFGGDSTLIIYGAPRPLEESACRAVLTALDMRANLTALNERLVERGETPIRIGVGINTGMALAGAVGPKERQEYTIIGDTVNLASRIEALAKEHASYDVLISGWTYEALGDRRREFDFADLGEVAIRGKAEPVRVWAVVGHEG
jgi:putative ABC transport system permease protein